MAGVVPAVATNTVGAVMKFIWIGMPGRLPGIVTDTADAVVLDWIG